MSVEMLTKMLKLIFEDEISPVPQLGARLVIEDEGSPVPQLGALLIIEDEELPIPQLGNVLVLRKSKNEKVKLPKISKRTGYTLSIFLERSAMIHGNSFCYNEITPECVVNAKSNIIITCRECGQRLSTTIAKHINLQSGCPSCAGNLKWDLSRFLDCAQRVHDGKYNYGNITSAHIKNKSSSVPVICNECSYGWLPTVNNHINHKSGCPNCAGTLRWTLSQFLNLARDTHGSKYNYENVTSDHVRNVLSHIPLSCNVCHYEWVTSINSHIKARVGCPDCAGVAPWTYDRVINRLADMDNDKFDYSQIAENDITNGAHSRLKIICKDCGHNWNSSIDSHINARAGCPGCAGSKSYSKAQIQWLDDVMIKDNITIRYALSPGGEHYIENIGKVDGYCVETNTVYEYHGNFWHGNPDMYHQDKLHPTVKDKTYGDLYRKTMARDQKIRDLGYNLVVKWETDLIVRSSILLMED
jgi:formylmethanofuran dehydrogenase subunit E